MATAGFWRMRTGTGRGRGVFRVCSARQHAGRPGGGGAALPRRDGAVRALRGRQPRHLAAGLSPAQAPHGPLRLLPPDCAEDPPRLARQPVPDVRRAGEADDLRGR
ncbi:unnamed protein product [Caretta caretta]